MLRFHIASNHVVPVILLLYCDPAKAKAEIGWEAKFGGEEMVRDSWNWQRENPEGYKTE